MHTFINAGSGFLLHAPTVKACSWKRNARRANQFLLNPPTLAGRLPRPSGFFMNARQHSGGTRSKRLLAVTASADLDRVFDIVQALDDVLDFLKVVVIIVFIVNRVHRGEHFHFDHVTEIVFQHPDLCLHRSSRIPNHALIQRPQQCGL